MDSNQHKDLRNEKHIFVFGVCGRSSTTAFQRICNSSNEICIWGEPWGIDGKFLELINHLHWRNDIFEKEKENHLEYRIFKQCFENNKHDRFYPNAIKPLDKEIEIIKNIFVSILTPEDTNIRRFGYKDITLANENLLNLLLQIFPRAYFVFLFRNPLRQWPSIKQMGCFPYSNDLGNFLNHYKYLSELQIEYHTQNTNSIFVESDSIRNSKILGQVFEKLDINHYDEELLQNNVSTVGSVPLDENDRQVIEESFAMQNYHKMNTFSQMAVSAQKFQL